MTSLVKTCWGWECVGWPPSSARGDLAIIQFTCVFCLPFIAVPPLTHLVTPLYPQLKQVLDVEYLLENHKPIAYLFLIGQYCWLSYDPTALKTNLICQWALVSCQWQQNWSQVDRCTVGLHCHNSGLTMLPHLSPIRVSCHAETWFQLRVVSTGLLQHNPIEYF